MLEKNKWTASYLDKKIGSTRAVHNIMRGSSKNPTISILNSIANAFNITVQDLISKDFDYEYNVNLELYDEVSNYTCSLLKKHIKNDIDYEELKSIILEIYDYSKNKNHMKLDKNFASWFIAKHYPN